MLAYASVLRRDQNIINEITRRNFINVKHFINKTKGHKMKFIKKSLLPLTLSLAAFSNSAVAAEYSGYVSKIYTGPVASTTFNTVLIGMSSTDGGAVERYIFTSDSDYTNMVVSARANHEVISISYSAGTANAISFN